MTLAAILLALGIILLLYMGNKFLRDARGIRNELASGGTLRELNDMVNDTESSLCPTTTK